MSAYQTIPVVNFSTKDDKDGAVEEQTENKKKQNYFYYHSPELFDDLIDDDEDEPHAEVGILNLNNDVNNDKSGGLERDYTLFGSTPKGEFTEFDLDSEILTATMEGKGVYTDGAYKDAHIEQPKRDDDDEEVEEEDDDDEMTEREGSFEVFHRAERIPYFDAIENEPSSPKALGGIAKRRFRELVEHGQDIKLSEKFDDMNWQDLNECLKEADDSFFNYEFFTPEDSNMKSPMEEAGITGAQAALNRERSEITAQRMAAQHELAMEEARFQHKLKVGVILKEGITTRITKLGNEHSFKALVIGGTEDGYAGFGIGKALNIDNAIIRARRDIKRNMIFVPREEYGSLIHPCEGYHNSTKVKIWRREPNVFSPNKASPLMDVIFRAFGITNAAARTYGPNNIYSVIYAVWDALSKQQSLRKKALLRGKNYYKEFDPTGFPRRSPNRRDVQLRNARISQVLDELRTFQDENQDENVDPSISNIDYGYERPILDRIGMVDTSEWDGKPLPKELLDHRFFDGPVPEARAAGGSQ